MKQRNSLAIKLIEKYQQNKSLIGSGHCRFYPTCSNYAKEAYQKFNFFYASLLTTIRLLRCNPLARRRYYPVPLTKKEKQDILYLNNIDKYLNNDFTEYIMSLEKNEDINNLYPYLYDYYYLPKKAHFKSLSPSVYASRFILSEKLIDVKNQNDFKINFDELLKIVKELKNNGYISKDIKNEESIESNNYLYHINDLNIPDILNLMNINEGLVIINNYDEEINYLDFKELDLKESDLKNIYKYKEKYPKLIIKTKIKDIVKYLSIADFTINLYDTIDDINYLYHINKKR